LTESKPLRALAPASIAVLTCVILDVALHRLGAWAFDFNYFDNGLPQSVLVRSGFFPLAALLGFGIMFGFLALVYYRTGSGLGAEPMWAGQRFFGPIALVMFFGVLESAFAFATPFKSEIITAFADAIPYVLLGALLGRFARPEAGATSGREGRRAPWQSMLWVALVYVAGRYLISYTILHIVSGYMERAAGTLAWTIGCGLSMGAFYWLAGSAFPAATPMQRAVRVGGLTLGIFWLMVQLFYALIFAVSIADLLLRAAADPAYLVMGIYSFEKLFRSGNGPAA